VVGPLLGGLFQGCLLFVSFFVSCDAMAVDEIAGQVSIRFQRLGIENGLSQSSARALAQDRDGFLWVGTQDGLNRYDGNEFRVFRHDPDDESSLSDNHVTALAVDSQGVLWVGTQSGGLSSYEPDRQQFHNYRPDQNQAGALASLPVSVIATDRKGWIWIGSGNGHIQRMDPQRKSFSAVPGADPATLGQVRALLALANGDMLVGGSRGLWRYSAGTNLLAAVPTSASGPQDIHALAMAADGSIWAGTDDSGLWHMDDQGRVLAHIGSSDGLAGDDVRALLFDRRGALWIGSFTGLSRIDEPGAKPRSWKHNPMQRDGLGSNRVNALLEDRDGMVWIGTWLDGAHVFTSASEAFTELRGLAGDPRALPSSVVRSVLAEPDGTLWLGLLEGGGLVHLDLKLGVQKRYTARPGDPSRLASDRVQTVMRDLDGSLWVGSIGAGLQRMLPGTKQFENFDAGGGEVLSLYVDRLGTLWIGYQDGGLGSLCRGCRKILRYRQDERSNSLPGDTVGSIFETAGGDLWVGARPGGLARLERESGTFTPVSELLENPGDLRGRAITMIIESRRGDLWIGTQGDGVLRLQKRANGRYRAMSYANKQGLAAEAIGGLVEDNLGRVWVSTTRGISRIDPDTGRIENFGARAGAQMTGYFVNSAARLTDGRIVFGGLGGLTMFDPAKVTSRDVMRAPVLTNIRTYGVSSQTPEGGWQYSMKQRQKETDHLILDPGAGGFGITFSALAFVDAEQIQYSYRLDPLDSNWIDAGPGQRSASYPHLPPGDYTLRLRASYPGETSGPERLVKVSMGALWWQSRWASAGYFVFGALLLLMVVWALRQRLRERLRAETKIRESEQRLRLALWGTGDELWDLDLARNQLRRTNPLRHLKASDQDVIEQASALREHVHPDDIENYDRAMQSHFKGETDFFDATCRVRDLQDNWSWVRTRGRVVERDAHGRAKRLVGTSGDVNQIKQHEQALADLNHDLEMRVNSRTEALQQAYNRLQGTLEALQQAQQQLVESEKLAALGGLVAGIAHEINTPLGIGVTAASHLEMETRRLGLALEEERLTKQDLDRFRQTAMESAQLILRNLQRADKLIKSFKQVAVDQSSEKPRQINLRNYFDEVITSLHPTLKKTLHEISIDCPDSLVFETFPGAIYQIVMNLVMNSLLHAFDDGMRGKIGLRAWAEGDMVLIEYSDNGKGMVDEVRRRMFEPFFTTRRGEGGSGLGMHIVWNLATQMLGGTISCESAPGEGVRFILRMPDRVKVAA